MAVFTKGNIDHPVNLDHKNVNDNSYLRGNDIVLLGYTRGVSERAMTVSLRDLLVNNPLSPQGAQGSSISGLTGIQGIQGFTGQTNTSRGSQGTHGVQGLTGRNGSLPESQMNILIEAAKKLSVPIGSIVIMPITSTTLTCWKICQGQYIDGSAYPDYAEQVGEFWGASVNNTYKIPDLIRGVTFLGSPNQTTGEIKDSSFLNGTLWTSIDWSSMDIPYHSHQIKFARAGVLDAILYEEGNGRPAVSSAETAYDTPAEATDVGYSGDSEIVKSQSIINDLTGYSLYQLKMVPFIKVRNNS